MKKLYISIIFSLLCTLMITGCAEKEKYFRLIDSSVQMYRYEEYTLNVETNVDETEIEWKSSSNSVCSVKRGVVTSLGTGRATITAKYGSDEYTCTVLVLANAVGRSLSVSESSIVMDVGSTTTLGATMKESGQEVPANIVFESSDSSIVSVDQNGLISANTRGTAVVSAFTIYKGQTFTKDVVVKSVSISSKETSIGFEDETHSGSSLTEYSNGESLGFDATDKVFEYVTSGGVDSRIFSSDAYTNNVSNADILSFKIKFTEVPTEGTSLYLANSKKPVEGNESLYTSSTALVFYDYKGRIADYVRLGKVYTVVINLNKNGQGMTTEDGIKYIYGFYFNASTTCYISQGTLSSEDYLYETLGFEKPEELPTLGMCYLETGSGLDLGIEKSEYFDKYWVGYSSGTAADWDECIWSDRIGISGIGVSKYKNYAYYQFDVVFTDVSFRQILIWTGGYHIRLDQNMNLSSTEGTPTLDDIFIYKDDVRQLPGTKFEANVVYTFKIRVQKDNSENVAFGMSVNSATKNAIYFGNPNFTMF